VFVGLSVKYCILMDFLSHIGLCLYLGGLETTTATTTTTVYGPLDCVRDYPSEPIPER